MRTGRIAVFGALATAGALCLGSSAALAQSINIGSAQGNQGSQVTISVSLSAGTAQIAGTQNDIAFDAAARIAATEKGKCSKEKPAKVCSSNADCTAVADDVCAKAPDCSVNPAIDKGGTAFSFRPAGCPLEQGGCTGIRALVLALNNADAIPDGSTLYTCVVKIAADAANGDYPLTASGVILSDPAGETVASVPGQNGNVTVGEGGGPTPTPTTAPVVCDAPAVQAGTVQATPGTQVPLSVTLKAGTAQVAGTQNDIAFEPKAKIAATAMGKCSKEKPAKVCSSNADCTAVADDVCAKAPDCSVNPAIDKGGTAFSFRPAGCPLEQGGCTGIRALVLALNNADAIPDGSVLYTCNVDVASDADSTYPLTVSGVILSDPAGETVPDASACSGAVVAGGAEEPTATPTTAVPPTATATPPPAATATITETPAPTQTAKPGQGRVTKGASAGDTRLDLTNVNGFASSGMVTVEGIAQNLQYTSISGKTLILAAGLPAAVPVGALVTFVPGGGGTVSFDDDDGCQIATRSHGSVAWMLLVPAVGLLVLRRRSR